MSYGHIHCDKVWLRSVKGCLVQSAHKELYRTKVWTGGVERLLDLLLPRATQVISHYLLYKQSNFTGKLSYYILIAICQIMQKERILGLRADTWSSG